MARPISPVTRVIIEFINSGITSNKELATKVARHFPGEIFDTKKLIQRIADTRYRITRQEAVNGEGEMTDG